jgi:hypothetical protein
MGHTRSAWRCSATAHRMGIYTELILPQAMQIVGERVNGEQMVGAGKMGIR